MHSLSRVAGQSGKGRPVFGFQCLGPDGTVCLRAYTSSEVERQAWLRAIRRITSTSSRPTRCPPRLRPSRLRAVLTSMPHSRTAATAAARPSDWTEVRLSGGGSQSRDGGASTTAAGPSEEPTRGSVVLPMPLLLPRHNSNVSDGSFSSLLDGGGGGGGGGTGVAAELDDLLLLTRGSFAMSRKAKRKWTRRSRAAHSADLSRAGDQGGAGSSSCVPGGVAPVQEGAG